MISSLRVFGRRAGSVFMAAAVLLATAAPGLASAAQATERSIALSSSSKSATSVSYTVNFKAVGAAGAFVVDFCSNSPVIGQSCTAPTGFNASSAASATSGFTDVTGSTSKIVIVGTIGAAANVSVAVTGITNPSSAGPLYARIVTYDTDTNADAYTSTNLGTGNVDDGGVAISITDTVGVSGAVLESLTFCVANATITAGCANASSNAPVIKIGETIGSTVALDASSVSTGDIFTQVSTNALGGAIIRLKSNTDCGGMKRVGASVCDIAPALQTGVAFGEAKFGVRANAEADTGTNPNGTFQIVSGSGYDDTNYALNYLANNSTGITSPFGDPILDTDNAPANGKNMKLTFGASVSNSTPAGLYSTDLSLVATGKF